jgi:hypothetical protein
MAGCDKYKALGVALVVILFFRKFRIIFDIEK